MTENDLYWLAGLLEGEGSFTFIGPSAAHPTRREWRVEVSSTDKDVVDKAAALMGGKSCGPYGALPNKPFWRVSLSRRDEAIVLLKALHPLMGKRRRERIADMLLQNSIEPPRRKPGRKVND